MLYQNVELEPVFLYKNAELEPVAQYEHILPGADCSMKQHIETAEKAPIHCIDASGNFHKTS